MSEQHVIERWWQKQPGNLVCLSVKLTDCLNVKRVGEKVVFSDDGVVRDYFFNRHRVDIADFIDEHCSHGMTGLNFYFCPHLFVQRRRLKVNAVDCRGLYADLDDVNPDDLGRLKPTIAIETSPDRYVGLWQTDTPTSDQLNKRLTYFVDADRGNWKRTQLLRLPGTHNNKYDPAPRVKTLWDDGPVHAVAALERMLPLLPTRAIGDNERQASQLSMRQILDRHHIKGWLREELLGTGQVGSERRHRMHWKLACSLHEAGVSAQEAFTLLWATNWNKHMHDGNGADAVWALVDKVWTKRP
jgi:RepB DNA-primase from phage plasmid